MGKGSKGIIAQCRECGATFIVALAKLKKGDWIKCPNKRCGNKGEVK